MTTVIPQSELTRRAMDWICEQAGQGADAAAQMRFIEPAAVRFNLGPLEVEFLERFYSQSAGCGGKGEKRP
jgi:hypothetical protein